MVRKALPYREFHEWWISTAVLVLNDWEAAPPLIFGVSVLGKKWAEMELVHAPHRRFPLCSRRSKFAGIHAVLFGSASPGAFRARGAGDRRTWKRALGPKGVQPPHSGWTSNQVRRANTGQLTLSQKSRKTSVALFAFCAIFKDTEKSAKIIYDKDKAHAINFIHSWLAVFLLC